MNKPRKQHQLFGKIDYVWLNHSRAKQYKNQPFYCLDITEIGLINQTKQSIYAFTNLVSESIWKALAKTTWKNKKYLFLCEKRVRGWRLRDWKEIT